jgi:hypothetical protein
MRTIAAVALLGALCVGASACAADAVVHSWKLNVAMSRFSGPAPMSGTRVYTESADGKTYDDTLVFDRQ